jgi:hypothetical protein
MMIASVLQVLEQWGGKRLGEAALNLHATALTVLAIFWSLPILRAVFRRINYQASPTWVSLWQCPACGQFNRRSFFECQRCQSLLPTPWWKRWEPTRLIVWSKRTAGGFLAVYRGLGWILLYAVPALAVWAFRLTSFNQNAVREILGSVALLFLLLALFFFRKALRCLWRSPVDILVEAIAGVAATGFFLAASFLWAAAPFPPNKPLATLQALTNGQIQLVDSGGHVTKATAIPQPGRLQFSVQCATFSWPLLQIDQTFITRLAGRPAMEPWLVSLLTRAALAAQKEGMYWPRLVLLDQTFVAVPGHSYVLYRPASKVGLALKEQSGQAPSNPRKSR